MYPLIKLEKKSVVVLGINLAIVLRNEKHERNLFRVLMFDIPLYYNAILERPALDNDSIMDP